MEAVSKSPRRRLPAAIRLDPPADATLFAALRQAAILYRGLPGGIEDGTGAVGRDDLLKRALGAARIVSKLAPAGGAVGILLPNVAGTLAAVIGCSAVKRVPALLNYGAGADTINEACRAAQVHVIVTSRAFVEKAGLGPVIDRLEPQLHYIEDLRERLGLLDKLWIAIALLAPALVLPRGEREAAAVILFTSGSEGAPKGVVLSHRALLANIAQILSALAVGPEHAVFNALPIFHSFGLTAGALLPLLTGMRCVLYVSPLHYKQIPGLIRQSRATILFGTNTFLRHYADHAEAGDFASLRLVVAGAERLTEELRQRWQRDFGIDILEGYGCTETAPVLAVNLPDANRPGTVGRLLQGIEGRAVPVEGIASGGSLQVRGPNIMSGYLRATAPGVLEPPATALGHGWYDTGDIVEIDAEGYVRILGRAKRFAKVAGEMVSLAHSEDLARHARPDHLHAAASAPDRQRGERIVLFTTATDLQRHDLAQAAHETGVRELAIPREIVPLESLPVLGTGKTDHQTLARMASALPEG
jgi:acyl-[acyl-carrier-protein]-phospholipid O-acyltransferase/long-chain-fatty-acid--[acyl-carrier-protein] ligase